MLTALFIILLAILIWYVFANFLYAVGNNFIDLKWRIFKFLPIWNLRIPLENIQEARFYKSWDIIVLPLIFGNLLAIRKGVVLILKKPLFTRTVISKKVILTPSNPAELIEEIKSKMAVISKTAQEVESS